MPRSKSRETRHSAPAGAQKRSGSHPQRTSGKSPGKRVPATNQQRVSGRHADLWGRHAVFAALANPRRRITALWAIDPDDKDLRAAMDALAEDRRSALPPVTRRDRDQFAALCGEDAIHQGIAVAAAPLPTVHLEDILEEPADRGPILVLDQVTDPHNVGAILRSVAALGGRAVVVQDRHAPQITGTLARIASGAVEMVPLVRVGNLSRAIDAMKSHGFWTMGLDERGVSVLERPDGGMSCAIVLGAEGEGLRRLTRESCDALVRLPTQDRLKALNVSNAAAIALWECWGRPGD